MASQQLHVLVFYEDLSLDEVNGPIHPHDHKYVLSTPISNVQRGLPDTHPHDDKSFLSTPISNVQRGLPDTPDAPLPLLARNRSQDICMYPTTTYPTNMHVPRRIRLAPRSTHRSSNEFPIFPF